MDTDMQNDVDNIFMRKCKLAVDENPERLLLTKLGNLMPRFIPILLYIMIGQTLLSTLIRALVPARFLPQIEAVPALWILNQVETIINARRQANSSGKHHEVDLLQLMLDVATHDDIKVNSLEHIIQLISCFSSAQDDLNDGSTESKKLHEEEVTANMLLFMITGYDSVSTAIASCTYVLATKSDIQEKLRAEIDEQEWNDDNQLNYDIVVNMTYMDMFVREVLRMYPIAVAAIKRECNTTTTVCGHEIEKGHYFSTFESFLYFFFLLCRCCHSTRCSQYSL
jgi:hypothetical protein